MSQIVFSFYVECAFTQSVLTAIRKQIEGQHTYNTCTILPNFDCEQINRFVLKLLTAKIFCHSLYTAFSSNVGASGMWACSLFLAFIIKLIFLSQTQIVTLNALISDWYNCFSFWFPFYPVFLENVNVGM